MLKARNTNVPLRTAGSDNLGSSRAFARDGALCRPEIADIALGSVWVCPPSLRWANQKTDHADRLIWVESRCLKFDFVDTEARLNQAYALMRIGLFNHLIRLR